MYTLIFLLALTVSEACSKRNNQAPPQVWQVLVAKNDGFKIDYPKNWNLREHRGSTRILFLAPADMEGFANNFSMIIQDAKVAGISNMNDLDDLARRQIKTSYGKNTKIRMRRGMLKGYHSSEYRFQNTFRGLDMKWRQWAILKGRTIYIFTYAATSDTFKRDLEVVEEMLESFQFTGKLT